MTYSASAPAVADGEDEDGDEEAVSLSVGTFLRIFSVAPVCRVFISWVMFQEGSDSVAFTRRIPLLTRALEIRKETVFVFKRLTASREKCLYIISDSI